MTMTTVLELRLNHEEADSRLLLHTSRAAHLGSNTVVFMFPDSNVAIIAIGISHTGIQQRKRNIDITQIRSTIGPEVCEALISYLAFSVCDSTSAFFGDGKAIGYKLLHDHRPFRSTMAKLDKLFVADEELLQEGEAAVCALYGRLQEYDV